MTLGETLRHRVKASVEEKDEGVDQISIRTGTAWDAMMHQNEIGDAK